MYIFSCRSAAVVLSAFLTFSTSHGEFLSSWFRRASNHDWGHGRTLTDEFISPFSRTSTPQLPLPGQLSPDRNTFTSSARSLTIRPHLRPTQRPTTDQADPGTEPRHHLRHCHHHILGRGRGAIESRTATTPRIQGFPRPLMGRGFLWFMDQCGHLKDRRATRWSQSLVRGSLHCDAQ